MSEPNETKRLSPAYAFKLARIEEAGSFAGYASTFGGPPDSYGDVIAPGAFAAALKSHDVVGSRPAMLWQHDTRAPIGRWTRLVEDRRGLRVEGRLTLEVQRAAEAYALLRDGALGGLSIGFRSRRSEAGAHGGRLLTEIELIEISLVTLPANAAARVAAVKDGEDGGVTNGASEELASVLKRAGGVFRAMSERKAEHGRG